MWLISQSMGKILSHLLNVGRVAWILDDKLE
jgi:hypothetical protein